MKKHVIKFFALALCIAMLCTALTGCSLLEQFGISLPELPFLDQPQEETESSKTAYTLPGKTDFYAQPSWDAVVLATFYEGHTVTYVNVIVDDRGASWALSDAGWFCLDGKKPVEILNSYDMDQESFVTEYTVTFEEPGFSAAQRTQVAAGSPLHISQLAETAEGFWANTDAGWIPKSSLYIPGEVGQYAGYGVVREDSVVFLSAPGVQSHITASATSGTRFPILEQIEIDGYWYGYTDNGWVTMDSVYVEGTEGLRPCRAMVIDTTPLNVRIGPGTGHEVITTLKYGDYVDILERVKYNGSDWGFTGEGWIYMDLTKIQ